MTKQILLNLTIGMVWMLLHDEWSTLSFSVGYIIGLGFIFALRRFFPEPFYGTKLWAIIKLLLLFGYELLQSSRIVIGQIIRPRINIKPGIFKIHTSLKTEWEMTILANLLTLTPGSVVLEVAPEEGIMYIHAMDVSEVQRTFYKAKDGFERIIMEVTR